MNTQEEILDLIKSNPGVTPQKLKEILERSRANRIPPRGYRLASPLEIHRYRVRVQDEDKSIQLRTH